MHVWCVQLTECGDPIFRPTNTRMLVSSPYFAGKADCVGCDHALVSYCQLDRRLWYIEYFLGQIYWLYSGVTQFSVMDLFRNLQVRLSFSVLILTIEYHERSMCCCWASILDRDTGCIVVILRFAYLSKFTGFLSLPLFCHWDAEILTIKYSRTCYEQPLIWATNLL